MDPKMPFQEEKERREMPKPDAQTKRDDDGHHFTDDVKKPIEEREKQVEQREHGELTEE